MNHRIAAALVAAAALAACQKNAPAPATPLDNKSQAALEERLSRVEQYLAKNAEAIDIINKLVAQQKQTAAAQEASEPAPDAIFAVAIADNVKAGLVEGPAGAAVTVIKAFDFACPHCQRMSPILSELVKEYAGKLRVVYMDRVVHDYAAGAHRGGCAAAKQGKYVQWKHAFWEKNYALFEASNGRDRVPFQEPALLATAKGIGLDMKKFTADLNGAACQELVARQGIELDKFKVDGTPTFFINGAYVSGGIPKQELKGIIDARLKIVDASGVPAAQYYDKEILGKGEKRFRSKVDPKP